MAFRLREQVALHRLQKTNGGRDKRGPNPGHPSPMLSLDNANVQQTLGRSANAKVLTLKGRNGRGAS